ncbi:molybdopterin-dependent oxidoreductase [Novosphingobium sp. JCM 18896]|uniref:molybdopterin-dependent oxidoreductase n=1 Tax=Novosphingobium sp. JCM 18896 TaxID=2989731 RepID=UPI0022227BBA|nr:molybdopterin-dependent oxidoreductase [Novosphingobium sp. JCM 18896]MCW1432286.1 molybdopterin-dependent oxidoreductase [Novosphingobium sp. JCM 18896]
MSRHDANIAYRTCPLCEATCGLRIEQTHTGTRVTGDSRDPMSRGYLCPKGASLVRSDEDRDRIEQPLIRDRASGERRAASWEEAFHLIDRALKPIREGGDPDALAFYYGSGIAHTIANVYYGLLAGSMPTNNLFGSSTVDQAPKQVACALMFGHPMSIPIPDIDHGDYLLILGANPAQSNGSLFTAPGLANRIRRLRQRGGRVVVVDPRRTDTAEIADEHVFIRPAGDALFLAGMLNTLFAEQLVNLREATPHVESLAELQKCLEAFTPERVAQACGVPAPTIRRLARDIAAAPSAAVYGRLGTTTQEFGTLASWMIDLVNILTGNLDRRGGVMFPLAAVAQANSRLLGRQLPHRLFGPPTRVRGAPSVSIVRGFERPAVTLAEEIETPGRGRIRALITVGANPVLTRPNSARLKHALTSLDFMVSIDPYLNETTRFADVLLPSPPDLAKEHYPATYMQWSTRNQARWTPRSRPLRENERCDSEIYLRLANILRGAGADADPWDLDQSYVESLVDEAISQEGHRLFGRARDDILAQLGPRRGVQRILDFYLRSGPYGDAFESGRDGLTFTALENATHGIDLGPLQPRLPEILSTPSGKIELAPDVLVDDLARLSEALDRHVDGLLLVGRRHMRSNNSWMHNVDSLMRGKDRCTLQINPVDAAMRGVESGDIARVSNDLGELLIEVEETETIMPGVISIPHGFGHDDPETRMDRAKLRPGGNVNLLVPDDGCDPLSGNAILSGVEVEVTLAAPVPHSSTGS